MQISSKAASRTDAKVEQDQPQLIAAKTGPYKEIVEKFKKTAICRYYPKCSKGDECFYAHSRSELHVRPNFTKTRMCAGFLDGRCKLSSDKCRFAHGWHELRSNDPFEAPLYPDGTQFCDSSMVEHAGAEAFVSPPVPLQIPLEKMLLIPDMSKAFGKESRFSSTGSSIDTTTPRSAEFASGSASAFASGSSVWRPLQHLEESMPSTRAGDDCDSPLQVSFLQASPPAGVVGQRRQQVRSSITLSDGNRDSAAPIATSWLHPGLGHEVTIIGRLSV